MTAIPDVAGFEAVGYAAAALTTLAFLPQLLRVLRTGGVRDLSAGMLALQSGGCALWLAYGVIKGDAPLMLANGLTASMVGVILALKLASLMRGSDAASPSRTN